MNTHHTQGNKTTAHIPVLLQEVIDVLALEDNDVVVDGTAGGGGHTEAILRKLGSTGRYIGIDQDTYALERVREKVGDDARVTLVNGNFRNMKRLLEASGVNQVTKILLDLGLSSDQLETKEGVEGRGFSFARDEPLLMTYEANPGAETLTAMHVVNEWTEENLADVIYGFGGERRSRKIARALCKARAEKPILTSGELASVVEAAVGKHGRTHPATRTFQAIRIAVNDEFGAIEAVLAAARDILSPKGRIAVISFHSLEDRLIKRTFKDWKKEEFGSIVTKKPIAPTRDEILKNRRARSAKLRCFCKA